MDTVCRVCIIKAAKCTLLNTKIEDSSNLSFFDFLNKCTSINACGNDKLPQGLCSICTNSMKTFYSFVKLAERSDTILREALKTSLAAGRYNDNREISCEEITTASGKIEEESEGFNKEESLHSQTSTSSTGSSFYILDLIKEEPGISESTAIAEFNENEELHCNLDHPEGSVEEPDDISSCIDHRLANVDVDRADSHIEKTYKCIQCDIAYNDREEFRTHCRNHIYGNKHERSVCGKKFARHKHLDNHLVIHENIKYECEICSEKFSSKRYLNFHMENHNGTTKKCDQCDKEFTNSYALSSHMKRHNDPKPVKSEKCEICSKQFRSKQYLNFHMESHKAIIKKCDHCDKEFTNSDSLRRHMKRHNDPKPVKSEKCEICSEQFSSKRYLNFHMENHNGITKKCDQCDKEFTNSYALSSHMKRHTAPKPVKCKKCEICSKQFRSKQYFNIHMESHKAIIKKCDHCDKEFTNSDSLKRHVKRHTEPKPVICETCEICGKKFCTKQSLKFHMENHMGITKKCILCNKEYKNSNTLIKHMKLHTEQKRFNCEICSKQFRSKQNLNIHMESHVGIIKKCNQCGKVLKNSASLWSHMKLHSNPKPFMCGNCGQSFSRKTSYTRHMEVCKPVGNAIEETKTIEG